MNGAERICATLSDLGVDVVFGLPGSQNVVLYEALRRSGLRSVTASDEGAAAFMAGGYARASGRVGVLTTIPGPGFLYALPAIAEARDDSAPLLWLTLRQPAGCAGLSAAADRSGGRGAQPRQAAVISSGGPRSWRRFCIWRGGKPCPANPDRYSLKSIPHFLPRTHP